MADQTNIYNKITGFMSITVVPRYEPAHSNPGVGKYIFSYQITMENLGQVPVRLMSRHWEITDSVNTKREITGEGVVGLQPRLDPGEEFTYSSWCPLHSPIGKMSGHYVFLNEYNNETLQVIIPEFLLVADFKLN